MAGNQPSDLAPVIPEEESVTAPQIPQMNIQAPQQPDRSPAMGAAPLADPSLQSPTATAAAEPSGVDFSFIEEIPSDVMSAPTDEAPSPGASTLAHIRASLGRTPKEQASLFEAHYGKGNVRQKGNTIEFRNEGERKFRSVRGEDLPFILDMFESLAANAAPIAEGAVSLGAEMMGGGVGAMIGAGAGTLATPVVGTAAGGVIGAATGAAAAGAMGGAAGAAARDLGVRALGGEPDPSVSLQEEMLVGAGTGAFFGGAANLAGQLVSKIVSKSRPTNLQTIQEVGDVNHEVAALMNSFGIKNIPSSKVGEKISSRIGVEKRALGTQLGVVREAAYKAGAGKTYATPKLLAENENFLKTMEQNGVKFKDRAIGIDDGSTVAPEVELTGEQTPFTKWAANNFNALQKESLSSGGISVETIDKTLEKLQPFRGVGPNPTKDEYFARKLYRSLAEDRDEAYIKALEGTPEGEAFLPVFNEYRQKIGPAKRFLNEFEKLSKDGASEKIVNAVVQRNKVGRIREFKALADAGDNPETIQLLQGDFLRQKLGKYRDPNTGIYNLSGFNTDLNKYGPEVVNELFTPGQRAKINDLVKTMNKIDTSPIENTRKALDSVIELPFMRVNAPEWIRTIARSAKDDSQAMDYLLGEGIEKLNIPAKDRLSLVQQIVTDDEIARSASANAVRAGAPVIRTQTSRATKDVITEGRRDDAEYNRTPQSTSRPVQNLGELLKDTKNAPRQADLERPGQERFDSEQREKFRSRSNTNRKPDSIQMAPMTPLDTRQSTDRLLQRMRQLDRSGDPNNELPRIRATLRNRGIRASQ